MDPVAHTLLGGALGESGLKRLAPLGGVTLVVGANLPDIDVAATFVSGDFALGVRRGWTHGVAAVAVLPLVLAVAVFVLASSRGKRDEAGAPPLRFGRVAALAYLAVLSHVALDWLNNYGIRLLMPFDGRWFYGDAVFIIDPWLWLLFGAVVGLAHSRGPASQAAWIALLSATTFLVTRVGVVPGPAKAAWILGIGTLTGLRVWGGLQARLPAVARVALTAAALYVGVMVAGSRVARAQAIGWLEARGVQPVRIMAGPVPANPFVHDVIAEADDRYYFLAVDWLAPEPVRPSYPSVPVRDGPREIIAAALASPQVRGLGVWLRFPAFEVRERAGGYRVVIRDMRFRATTGIGRAQVDLPRDPAPQRSQP